MPELWHLEGACQLWTPPMSVPTELTCLFPVWVQLAEIVQQRSTTGRNYGVFLIPEGLIEYVPEMHSLITELNDLLAQSSNAHPLPGIVATQLTPKSQQVPVQCMPLAPELEDCSVLRMSFHLLRTTRLSPMHRYPSGSTLFLDANH